MKSTKNKPLGSGPPKIPEPDTKPSPIL